jgi:hypothetical protein
MYTVHANHPFCCYYCDTTCTEFDNIIKHSVKNHSLDVLKIKHLELSEKNGIYGYRSHNFNIIPRELDSTGKKIETNSITIITAKWMVCMYSVHGLSLSDDDN